MTAGVTSASLTEDGQGFVLCEAESAVLRGLDLTELEGQAGDCPTAPATTATVGDRDVDALGPGGMSWSDGQVDTQGPAFALASVGGDYVVTAGWDGVYLWDLYDPNFPQRARQRLESGPVIGVAPAGEGKILAFGPDGASVIAVDRSAQAPDIKLDTLGLQILRGDDGGGEGSVVIQNGGGDLLNITGAEVEGEGLSVEVQHNGFDEPPPDVLAQVDSIGGALVRVVLAPGAPAGELRGRVTLTTNDPDEALFQFDVIAGAPALANGDPVPDFRLPDLDGQVHQLSALRGKVVHLKFLNAICQSCRESIPVLEEELWSPLTAERDDVAAFVVHVGRQTRFAASMNDELGIKVPMVLDIEGEHFQGCSQIALGFPAYPVSLLVDKEGVARHVVGEIEPTSDEWRAWIEALLAE